MSSSPESHENLWYAESSERLRFMLILAILLHAVLILAMNFKLPDDRQKQQTLEITLARFDDQKAPDKADYLAQTNQQGSGEADDKSEPSTQQTAVFESETLRDQSAKAAQALNQTAVSQPPTPSPDQNQTEDILPVKQQHQGFQATLTTTHMAENKSSKDEQVEPKQASATQAGTSTSLAALNLEMANLKARIRQEQQAMARRPKVTRITSASTLADKDAIYYENWRNKIEMIGNLNYPEEARVKNIHGSLQLLVSINPDGSIHEVDILLSSGHPVLDDAAIRIVQLAAPFQPFPPEMRKRTDMLEFIRTWKFEKETRIY